MTSVPPSGVNLRGAVDLSSLVNRPAPGAASAPRVAGDPGATGAGAAGAVVPVPSLVLEGTDANFGELLELSMSVPVIVGLWAAWSEPSTTLTPVLAKLATEFGGRFVLTTVDVDANPQLAQAFAAQSVPTVAAVLSGQPVQLFSGAIPEAEIRDVVARLLDLAAQNGVTGVAESTDSATDSAAAEPVEPELPPLHQAAYDAIERADYPAAIAAYKSALASDPRDTMAVAGLAQVSLLHRLQGQTIEQIRSRAAAAPDDVDAQLLVADLDLSGGHIADAFDRLLRLFPTLDAAGKNLVRARLLELFEVVGVEDPRVAPARARLAGLLY
ncbi:tetratricopeptide repeat protein [Glaciibacter psychrotolerans]|uniref:Putative thioredoxin n=1 Tax=Glaciibacter psychrotolerans TaxID=670054 RepID=A0A7Z0EEE7_9MICO|nr:tetratricopeptide repeat protein [Leifsonia psychrotolerans]NYJ19424.1 putative thioredoxin [Leifsonia psychrotolerans]